MRGENVIPVALIVLLIGLPCVVPVVATILIGIILVLPIPTSEPVDQPAAVSIQERPLVRPSLPAMQQAIDDAKPNRRTGLDWTPEEWESFKTPKQPRDDQGNIPGSPFPKFSGPPR